MHLTGSMVFSDAVSSLYLSVVECKQSCPNKLGEFRKDEFSDFFGSYFHYMQYGYFKSMLFRLQDLRSK